MRRFRIKLYCFANLLRLDAPREVELGLREFAKLAAGSAALVVVMWVVVVLITAALEVNQ